MMLKIALTGGIATGKSYVLDQFRRRGVACLDADRLAHGVMSAGTEASQAIAERFGAEVIDADGAVNRRKLGPMVFGDPVARRDLEAIVHPAVYRAIAAALRGFERVGECLAVVDIPLLYETGHADQFDAVVVTMCPPELQVARMKERGLTETAARQRLAAQWPGDAKASKADYVITTDGTFADTDAQVDRVFAALRTGLA